MKFFALLIAILLTTTAVVCLYQSIIAYPNYKLRKSKRKKQTMILNRYRIIALCTLLSCFLATLFLIYSIS